MLDMSMFREHADVLRADHDKREMPHDNIDQVIRLDEEWRQARYDADQLRKKRNEAARGIAEAKKSGDSAAADSILAEVASLGKEIDAMSEKVDSCLAERDAIRMRVQISYTILYRLEKMTRKIHYTVYTVTRLSWASKHAIITT